MVSQVFLLVALVFGVVSADAPVSSYLPPGNGGYPSGGPSEEGAEPEPFNFAYEVKEAENNFAHKADSDGNTVKGEYKVMLPDGRLQIVSYTADKQGYNADVSYQGEATTGTAGGAGGAGGSGGYPSGKPTNSYLPPGK